jgi:glycolate oxidase FAD binding subunit
MRGFNGMILKPVSLSTLSNDLAAAHARGGKISGVDLHALHRVLAHSPEDMTVAVEAGISLATLQQELRHGHQWLPVDPPHPAQLSVGALLATNASGPRRFGYGTIRDYLIGIKVALTDGTVIKSGGNVVKNVAGYDLAKAFVGSYGTLGIIVEATFKLRPISEAEQFVQANCQSLEAADKLITAVLDSDLTPVVLDLHNNDARLALVAGFAGTREEVEWQRTRAAELGFTEPSSLAHEEQFQAGPAGVHRLSVLPSKLADALAGLGHAPFVARAGNGIIYHRGTPSPRSRDLPVKLMRRLEEAFDPKNILPELPV